MLHKSEEQSYQKALRNCTIWYYKPKDVPLITKHYRDFIQSERNNGTSADEIYKQLGPPRQLAKAQTVSNARPNITNGILPKLLMTLLFLLLPMVVSFVLSVVNYSLYYQTHQVFWTVSLLIWALSFWAVWSSYFDDILEFPHAATLGQSSISVAHLFIALISVTYYGLMSYLLFVEETGLFSFPYLTKSYTMVFVLNRLLIILELLLIIILVFSVRKVFMSSRWFLPVIFHALGGLITLHCTFLFLNSLKSTEDAILMLFTMPFPYIVSLILALISIPALKKSTAHQVDYSRGL